MRSRAFTMVQSLLAGLLLVWSMAPTAAEDGGAVAVVDDLHAALLEIMQNADTLGFEGRRDRIAPVVEKSFDLKFISRFTVGRYWDELSGGQQDAFRDVFSRWTIAHYAARFDGYDGQKFKTLSSDEARKGRVLVRTVLEAREGGGDNVTLDYLLRKTTGKWRIINVIANGVSDLSLKRADYGAVLKSQGIDSLITKLDAQIGELQSGS